ncbi:hypothetical protein N879_01950 [Alcaligenes sp. EGD-AK7]|nr:hypothetical protein C660_00590 [Alcaligenes sp. HPC1271]ERI34304.1 hypothetical protein N879_01950 [Alcaligenes sp. EGD-AK7]
MKYALKLARHGSIFFIRVTWIGLMLVFDFLLMLINSSSNKNLNNMAAPEVPDPLDRMDPSWDFYWGDRE